uniref:Peptide-N-glycosidase F N-terminal domain-containing protein n=1 Tax=Mola mola TaxID=94237 RepID=A0A3Q3VQB7_MOLML
MTCLRFLGVVLTALVTVAGGKLKLIGDELASDLHGNAVAVRPAKKSMADGPEPGDLADSFTVRTLDGEFSYKQGPQLGPLIVHAFTNKSGFLECLWSSESSLSSLVEELPDSTQVLFLSLDDCALSDVWWMREQVRKKEVLSRLHFSPVPVFALGNWIPFVLYYWGCVSRNCVLAQAVFSSEGWNMPIIIKRLDARYDWLMTRWTQTSYQLLDAGDGCDASPTVAGAVAWVSEGNCSFFTKVQNMAKSNASGVLVYALPGNPIQDMNCIKDECNTTLNIPAAMVHQDPSVAQALRSAQLVFVSFQTTPSPYFFFGVDQQGALSEMGWFLYPSFSFVNWQAQWFDFYTELQTKLQNPAKVVPVFDKVQMQGEEGAVATVNMPPGLLDFNVLELDASLSCPGKRDLSCAHWDHTVQLFICCDRLSPHCNTELGRWITAFRRGIGRWLTDVSPLLPLLDGNKCTLTMKTVPWAMPWVVSLNLRFSIGNHTDNGKEVLHPFLVMSLYNGGTFDKNYNKKFQPIKFPVPASTKKVELYAVITAHGSDDHSCGEFCVTSHHFLFNAVFNNSLIFDTAGSPLGCTTRVIEGAVPNEHGTWLYGRGGWCDGLQVDPWRVDITKQLEMNGSNTVVYFGLFEGHDPNPSKDPGYIIMSSFLVFYK